MVERIKKLLRIPEIDRSLDIFENLPSDILNDLVVCPYDVLQQRCDEALTPYRLRRSISSMVEYKFYQAVHDYRNYIESRK